MYIQYNKSGWGRAKKQFFNGVKYDSKFEAGQAQELNLLQKAGEIKSFETHKKIPLIVNDYIVCDYYVDFVIHHKDGTTEFLETKGYATPLFRLKWKLFEALFSDKPNIRLTLIKQTSNWNLRKLKKATM